ncbi:phosphopantetheine-binding protein, partial [Streptomyces noursei]
ELDEVERVLESAPGVTACAVHEQDGRIEALAVPAGPQLDETAIRTYLASRLHSAMLPSVFTTVTELPRTVNGKADHRHEPPDEPTVQSSRPSGPALPPDDHERRLSRITWEVAQNFAQVLNLPLRQVQADSDFFTAGGDSITMAAFLARLESLAGAPVDTAALITAPTPEQITTLLLNAGAPK